MLTDKFIKWRLLTLVLILIPIFSWSEETIKEYPETLENYFIFNGPEKNSDMSLTEFTYFLKLCAENDYSYEIKLNLQDKIIPLVEYYDSEEYFPKADSIISLGKIPIYDNPGRYTIGYQEVFKWSQDYLSDKFWYAFNGFVRIVWLDLDDNGQPQSIGCNW